MDTEETNNQTFMNNPKHTSLKDLAQRLGVSIPTVSRALAGTKGQSRNQPQTMCQSQTTRQRNELPP